jgi:hypothetical protein
LVVKKAVPVQWEWVKEEIEEMTAVETLIGEIVIAAAVEDKAAADLIAAVVAREDKAVEARVEEDKCKCADMQIC